jgi:hypothetical protein
MTASAVAVAGRTYRRADDPFVGFPIAPWPRTQLPSEHWLPLLQSVSSVQLVLQPSVVQPNGAQATALEVSQVPAPLPLHVAAGSNIPVVGSQVAVPQTVLVEATWQAPPWHTPVVPQIVPESAHRPCGSAAPLATAAQVPTLLTLHAWHAPQLAVVQHTPSTQLLELQSCAAVQAAPAAFFTWHAPPALGQ